MISYVDRLWESTKVDKSGLEDECVFNAMTFMSEPIYHSSKLKMNMPFLLAPNAIALSPVCALAYAIPPCFPKASQTLSKITPQQSSPLLNRSSAPLEFCHLTQDQTLIRMIFIGESRSQNPWSLTAAWRSSVDELVDITNSMRSIEASR